MYITRDLMLYEPTCTIWENIALIGSYSTQSSSDIHQNSLLHLPNTDKQITPTLRSNFRYSAPKKGTF